MSPIFFNKRVVATLCITLCVPAIVAAQDRHVPAVGSQLTASNGTTLRVTQRVSSRSFYLVSAAPRILPENHATDLAAARDVATEQVAQLRFDLGIPDEATLEHASTVRAANVWRSAFRVSYHGIPVRDASVVTTLGAVSGKLMTVQSNVPRSAPTVTSPVITSNSIIANIPAYLGEDNGVLASRGEPQLVYVERNRRLRFAYEVTVRQTSPRHAWRLTVDAVTGKLLEKKEMLEFVGRERQQSTISAKLHCAVHPNSPFDTVVDVGLPSASVWVDGKTYVTDSNGLWSADVSRPTPAIITGFYGPYNWVSRHDGRNDTAYLFSVQSPYYLLWNDLNSNAAERDAFYHVNYERNYIRRLDPRLTELDSDQLVINVNLDAECNAFYDADSNTLNFFKGGDDCTNSAEVASVVYHEFGHRVAAARYRNSANGAIRNGALSEAFADLFSTFLRDDPTIGIGLFSNDRHKALRTCENTKTFPKDISFDPHESGEIITGAFWDLRNAIGHDAAERLFHQMEWLNPDAPDIMSLDILKSAFLDVLTDVLLVDDDDNDLANGTPHSAAIIQAFANHGITFADQIKFVSAPLADQDTASDGYAVRVGAKYFGAMGAIDTKSVELHYSVNDPKQYTTVPLTPISGTVFGATIPKVGSASLISYYFTARLSIDTAGTVTWPNTPLTFTVGYSSRYKDDCETDRGWTLQQPGDQAVHGLWTRATPIGTYDLPEHYVQQDSDHTSNGTMCYVTGNFNSPDIDADDVDSGAVTLTTNAIDASEAASPLVRYWYYYTNDQGDHPGEPVWVTQISSDGKIWKTIQNTHESTDGWVGEIVRVSDFVTPTSHIQLRFITSDYVGAVVEAGIDDIELLSAPVADVQPAIASVTKFGIISVYPNPTIAGGEMNVQFALPSRTHALMTIKDVFGNTVATLADEMREAGSYNARITSKLPAGIYWVVLSTPERRDIRRIVIE